MFTYVIHCRGFLKVGRTENPERRLRQLRTACPLPLSMIGLFVGDSERAAHLFLEENGVNRITGEWFEDNEQARDSLIALGLLEEHA